MPELTDNSRFESLGGHVGAGRREPGPAFALTVAIEALECTILPLHSPSPKREATVRKYRRLVRLFGGSGPGTLECGYDFSTLCPPLANVVEARSACRVLAGIPPGNRDRAGKLGRLGHPDPAMRYIVLSRYVVLC